MAVRKEGVYVRISGRQKESQFIRSVVDKQVRNEMKKLGRAIPIKNLILDIDRCKDTGKRAKYSIKGKLLTEKGLFFADSTAWDIAQAVSGVLKKLEREMLKKKGKEKAKKHL